jgi:tellurite resistance protein
MAKRKFPSLSSNTQVTLEPEVAIAIIGIASSMADGEGLGHEEDYALGEMLCSVSGFEDYSEEDYINLYNRAIEVINSEGVDEAFAQAVDCLPNKETKEAAYVTALMVITYDGEVPDEETEFIEKLQEALNISDKRAEKIFDDIFGEEEEEDEDE